MKASMTATEYREFAASFVKRNKYGRAEPIKRTYNGVVYDSAAESKYAAFLDIEQRMGSIRHWIRQVPYPLAVNGANIARVVIDFKVIHNDGSEELIEVKGFPTPAWRLKEKLFRAIYPETKLTVVKAGK